MSKLCSRKLSNFPCAQPCASLSPGVTHRRLCRLQTFNPTVLPPLISPPVFRVRRCTPKSQPSRICSSAAFNGCNARARKVCELSISHDEPCRQATSFSFLFGRGARSLVVHACGGVHASFIQRRCLHAGARRLRDKSLWLTLTHIVSHMVDTSALPACVASVGRLAGGERLPRHQTDSAPATVTQREVILAPFVYATRGVHCLREARSLSTRRGPAPAPPSSS